MLHIDFVLRELFVFLFSGPQNRIEVRKPRKHSQYTAIYNDIKQMSYILLNLFHIPTHHTKIRNEISI